MIEKLTVGRLVKEFNYNVEVGFEFLDKIIPSSHMIVPGLELSGYLEFYNNESGLFLGNPEVTYLKGLNDDKEEKILKQIITTSTPFVLLTEKTKPSTILKKVCVESKTPLLSTKKISLFAFNDCFSFIDVYLSKKEKVHGTLINIYNSGVLIKGNSGIGKSEIGLELIKRGHKFIADDSVITYKKQNKLYGKCVEHQKNIMEVRGLGLINVYRLFGLSAVLSDSEINYIIELVSFDEIKENDRIFDTVIYTEINGVKIPTLKLPVSGGRTLADIIEVSILELNARKQGYNTTKEYVDKFDRILKEDK